MTTAGVRSAERHVLRPLNSLLVQKARHFGWTPIVTASALFDRAGLCARRPLIRSIADSLRLQHDTAAAFHPSHRAHKQLADLVFAHLNFTRLLRGMQSIEQTPLLPSLVHTRGMTHNRMLQV